MAEGFEGPDRGLETPGSMGTPSGLEASGGIRGATQQVRDAAESKGRDLLDRAVEQKDALKQRAGGYAEDQRLQAASRVDAISRALHGAADSLRDSGESQLSGWVEQAAGQVERMVGYMQGKPASGMMEDLEEMARRNPGLFLGGTYLAGLAVGRFLRASSPAAESTAPNAESGDGLDTSAGYTGSTGSPWTGVGMAPSAQESPERGHASPQYDAAGSGSVGYTGMAGAADDGFGTSRGPGGGAAPSGRSGGDARVGEPGLTDEDLREAWHGADERRNADSGYGASGVRPSDSVDTGELTSYTNGDADEDDFDSSRRR